MAVGAKHGTFRYFFFDPLDAISFTNRFRKIKILFLGVTMVKLQGSRMVFPTLSAL